MPSPRPIDRPVQLLVEGKDQANFFEALCRHVSMENDVQIQNFGGITELKYFLGAFARSAEFSEVVESMGIVRDAEKNAESALESVSNSLRRIKFELRQAIDDWSWPVVRLHILPDGKRPGMLETLLNDSIADSPVSDCIDSFFTCVETLPNIEIRNPEKARAQAYLATQRRPGISIGDAAQKGYWALEKDVFSGVRNFLLSLKD